MAACMLVAVIAIDSSTVDAAIADDDGEIAVDSAVASHLLASVRTLFAWIRTSLSLVGSGIVLGRLYNYKTDFGKILGAAAAILVRQLCASSSQLYVVLCLILGRGFTFSDYC